MFQKDPLAGFGRVIFPPQKALKRETRSLTFDYQRFIGFINYPPHLGLASMKTGHRGTTAQTTPSTQKDCIWLAGSQAAVCKSANDMGLKLVWNSAPSVITDKTRAEKPVNMIRPSVYFFVCESTEPLTPARLRQSPWQRFCWEGGSGSRPPDRSQAIEIQQVSHPKKVMVDPPLWLLIRGFWMKTAEFIPQFLSI